MKGYYKTIFLCVSILSMLASCKKDEDTILPSVFITNPVSGEIISADSGFFVVANVSDNEIITDVTIKLFDLNSKEYFNGSRKYVVNKASAELVLFYEITDDEFISSNYLIELVANDGVNTQIASVEARINYTGYTFRGTLFSSSSNSTASLHLIKRNGSIQDIGQHNISCSGISTNKKENTYIVLERNSPAINGYNFIDNSLNWSNQLTLTGGTYQFSKLREIDQTIYCLSFNNQIYKFDLDGVARGVMATDNQPLEVKRIGNYLYTIEKRINDQRYFIGQYALTGVLMANRELNMEAVGIEMSPGNNVYILGNTSSGNGRLMEFKYVSGALNLIQDFNYPLLGSFSYRGKLYFNSSSTGNLYEYSINMTNGIIKSRNVFGDEFHIDTKNRVGLFNHYQNGNLYRLDLSNMSSFQIGNYPNKVNSFSPYYKK